MILNQFKSDNFDVHRDWVYIVENPTLSFNHSIAKLYHCRLLSIDEPKVDMRAEYKDAYKEAIDAGFDMAGNLAGMLGKGLVGKKGMALVNGCGNLASGAIAAGNAKAGIDYTVAQRNSYTNTTMSVNIPCGVLDLNGAGTVRESEFWLQHLLAARTLRTEEDETAKRSPLSALTEGYLKPPDLSGGMYDDDDRSTGPLNFDLTKAMKDAADAISSEANSISGVAKTVITGGKNLGETLTNIANSIMYRRYAPPIVDIYCRGRVFRGMYCEGITQSEVSKTLQPYVPRWYANYAGTRTANLKEIKVTPERTVPISCKWQLSFKPIDRLLMVPYAVTDKDNNDTEQILYMLRQCIWGQPAAGWKRVIDDLYDSGVFYVGQPDINWMTETYSPHSKGDRDKIVGKNKEDAKTYETKLHGDYWDLTYAGRSAGTSISPPPVATTETAKSPKPDAVIPSAETDPVQQSLAKKNQPNKNQMDSSWKPGWTK